MRRTRALILAAVVAAVLTASAAGLALLSRGAPYEYASNLILEPGEVPDIRLATASGEPFALSAVPGDLAVVYFGYTHCPDVCPLTLSDLGAAVELLPEDRRNDVTVVMVTVDPERDTPEVMERYVTYFHESFLGLSGSPEEVQQVLQTWGIHAERGEVSPEGSYFMSHPAGVYVVDSEQRLRLVIPPDLEPTAIADDLHHLLRSG